MAEIEQNQAKLEECQTYSKHYCTAVKVSTLSEWIDSAELLWTEIVRQDSRNKFIIKMCLLVNSIVQIVFV